MAWVCPRAQPGNPTRLPGMQPSERPAPADRPDHPDRPDQSAADRDRGLRARAEDWLAGEIDGHDAATVRGWLQAGDTTALEQAFGARLEFGTAGIRGRLGPGPAQMNRALVVRVTAGVAARLAREAPGGLVVVGRCLLYTSPSPRDGLLSR